MKGLVFLAITLFAFSCSPSDNNQATEAELPDIEIQVEGISSGQAYLLVMYTDQQFRVDSTVIGPDGTLRFRRTESYTPGYMFVTLPGSNYIQFLIDKDQTFKMKTNINDIVGNMQVEGSLDNELLYKNLKFERDFQPRANAVKQLMSGVPETDPRYPELKAQHDALTAEREAHLNEIFENYPNTFFVKFKTAGQNPELQDVRNPDGTLDAARQLYLYRAQFWDNVDFSDERLLYTPVIYNKLKRYITELTPQHPDSINYSASTLINKVANYPEYFKFFTNWVALQYEPTKTTLMDPEAVFVYMVKNYFTRDLAYWADSMEIYGLQLRAQEMAASLVGRKGPDVTANDNYGNPKSIYDITSPYIIVYLYNPTCDHCIEQTPKLVQWHKEWKSQGAEVYAIAVDTEEAEWKNFIAKNGMTGFTNVFSSINQSIYGKYYVYNTPEIYVLNPDRTIIDKNLKVHQIAEIINRDKS